MSSFRIPMSCYDSEDSYEPCEYSLSCDGGRRRRREIHCDYNPPNVYDCGSSRKDKDRARKEAARETERRQWEEARRMMELIARNEAERSMEMQRRAEAENIMRAREVRQRAQSPHVHDVIKDVEQIISAIPDDVRSTVKEMASRIASGLLNKGEELDAAIDDEIRPRIFSPPDPLNKEMKEGKDVDSVVSGDPLVKMIEEAHRERQSERSEQAGVCTICLDSKSNILLEPCYHIGTCDTCTERIDECPICRVKVTGTRKVFIV